MAVAVPTDPIAERKPGKGLRIAYALRIKANVCPSTPQPVIQLRQHGGTMLVIEAGKTVIVDREQMTTTADRAGITILALTDAEATTSTPAS